MGYDDVSERIIDAIGACEASGCMYIVTFLRIFVTIGELERGADSVKLPGRTSVSLAPRFFAKSFFCQLSKSWLALEMQFFPIKYKYKIGSIAVI